MGIYITILDKFNKVIKKNTQNNKIKILVDFNRQKYTIIKVKNMQYKSRILIKIDNA